MLEEARPMLEKLGMTSGHKYLTRGGGIFGIFYVLSTVSEDAGIEPGLLRIWHW